MRHILGISAYYHDAAAALLRDGTIVAAAQEERFTRHKNDPAFPHHAIQACLRQAQLAAANLDAVVFYDKPILKFARLLETSLAVAPRGLRMFADALPSWLGEKLNLRRTIRDELPELPTACPILFTLHHEAHAASAFFPSPFHEAAVLTVDGVGEYATTTIGHGQANRLDLLQELHFPHSLGLLYSAFTAYCGFRVNSGEYKLMGLAPYGEPRYVQAIYDHLIDLKPDGSFWLNPDYFDFLTRWRMTNDRFDRLFDGPPRQVEAPLHPRHMDVARSIQTVTEEIMLRLARHARELTGSRHLCLAGGVALNCVANGQIHRSGLFDQLWIQPAAGDAGGALGAALAVWHGPANPHPPSRLRPAVLMPGALLGPRFSPDEIRETLRAHHAVFHELSDDALFARTVELLRQDQIVGWFQGRMEFGPRALGNRSILADARSPRIQSELNLKIKQRESFRPFAPVVRAERLADYFELDVESPYMLLVAPVRQSLRRPTDPTAQGLDRLKQIRSTIPAVTHVDHSARIQTVTRAQNPRLYLLLERFEQSTGCGVLVNTSFNVRGEPIVGSPDDAYRCFINTAMDYLVLENFLLARTDQPHQHLPLKSQLVPD
ncbi:MAG: carbamoyltransferase [Verrucomicrobia bacterium]|nr:carbamoyltransferase [Verrucomicrobiota bacterium]